MVRIPWICRDWPYPDLPRHRADATTSARTPRAIFSSLWRPDLAIDDGDDGEALGIPVEYAWGSVVRCSLTGFDKKKQTYSGESGKVLPAFSDARMGVVVSNCFSKYLGNLPSRVELVVMLGNAEKYLEKMRQLVSRFYQRDFRDDPVDEGISYEGGGRLWVHVGHPSPGNGWYAEFLKGDPASGQGKKRELAKRAIERWRIPRSL